MRTLVLISLSMTACEPTTEPIDTGIAPTGPAVDILLILDDSPTMWETSEHIVQTWPELVGYLDGTDYQIGVTTTTNGGMLLDTVITPTTHDAQAKLARQVICDASCMPAGVTWPSDPSYQCGDPMPWSITEQWVTCECGADWHFTCNQSDPITGLATATDAVQSGGFPLTEDSRVWIVSDHDDTSPQAVSTYVDALSGVQVSAIVPEDSPRYEDAAISTEGNVSDLYASDGSTPRRTVQEAFWLFTH